MIDMILLASMIGVPAIWLERRARRSAEIEAASQRALLKELFSIAGQPSPYSD
jgi:hypothetical protein